MQKVFFLKGLITSKARNQIIVTQASRAAKAGRNVLILSERVAHLEELASNLKDLGFSVGVMVGSSTKLQRDEAQEQQIICATVQLVGTGTNIPRLDTLIFASPIQKVDQAIGRIRRVFPGKKPPFVLDLVDSNSYIGLKLGVSRKKKYLEKGWKVVGAEVFKAFEDQEKRRRHV